MTKNSLEKSLVDRLREIERIPSTIEVDKIEEYRKVIEEFRKSNPLVKRVIKSETTFSAEAERAIQVLGGNSYLPHYVSHSDTANFQELRDVIGYPYTISNNINLFGNPVVGSIGFGGLIYLASRASKPSKEKISRRDFLLGQVVIPSLGVAIGAVGGSFGSLIRNKAKDFAREDAAYADSIVQQLYRK